VNVEAEEVDELAGRVDLGLVDAFSLPQHGRRVEGVPVGTRNQVGGAEEDGGPI